MVVQTRQSRGETRRSELLDGLMQVFLADGFLSFSLDELAARLQCSKSTLYAVAPSKEQVITAVVRAFFRRATDRVEALLAREQEPVARIGRYLEAIATELSPASSAFFSDLSDFAPAREIYLQNTAIAARRVQELVAATGKRDSLNAAFIGAVAGTVMEAIQRGEMEAMTGLNDAASYQQLANLIVASVSGNREGDGA
jgi:AcrR family transcriptional regulator